MIARVNSFFLVAVACVMMMATSTEAYDRWCACSNYDATAGACNKIFGNWDGGSCGVKSANQCNGFGRACGFKYHCWDSNNQKANC